MTIPNNPTSPETPSLDWVVLVDPNDREVGVMEKMEAHRKGLLHRAFSLFIFNSSGHWLLQQRAFDKYHSGGLWTNACCSHPRRDETTSEAVTRRLKEEMGMYCQVKPLFQFQYRSHLDHGLIEHELDHVFMAYSDQPPRPNPSEVAAFRYIPLADLERELSLHPERFTVWFRICFEQVKDRMKLIQLGLA